MIRGIGRIESAGGHVMVAAADVTDLKQMRAVVREATKKFGAIHGVIHAAGISGSTPIGLKTTEELDQVMRPKDSRTRRARADFRRPRPRFYGAVFLGGFVVGPRGSSRLRRRQRLSRRVCGWDVGRRPLAGRLDQLGHLAGSRHGHQYAARGRRGKTKPQALNFGLPTAEGDPRVQAGAGGAARASDRAQGAAGSGHGGVQPSERSRGGASAPARRGGRDGSGGPARQTYPRPRSRRPIARPRPNCRPRWPPCGSTSCAFRR